MDQTLQALLAAIASFFVITLILGSILIICNSESNKHHRRSYRAAPKPNPTLTVCDSFDPSLPHVSMQELVAATQGFSKDLIIGDGSFGLVYKAHLRSGVVAAKRLSPDAFQGLREFQAEMETLGKIRHPNIVRLLGYSAAGQDRVLIYEFVAKGSLDQWLYATSDDDADNNNNNNNNLTWNSRVKIVRGLACGLAHMHHGLEKPVIHRDIKASNLLLDSEFGAHIADFGLARMVEGPHSHVLTQVAGTMGYMPPEYMEGVAAATTAGDVYSFGVLVVEAVAGRRPHLPFPGEDGREVRLMEWARGMAAEGRYVEMVDVCIEREELEEGLVEEVFKIGLDCAQQNIKNRPTMIQVVDRLNHVLDPLRASPMGECK